MIMHLQQLSIRNIQQQQQQQQQSVGVANAMQA
jgi:hypothetical protein